MRKARIKERGQSWYHIVSRTAFQLFKFDDGDKDMFVAMLRRCAYFSGIEILNFCVMSNHFHILAKVPEPAEITEDILLDRISALYGEKNAKSLELQWKGLLREGKLRQLKAEQDSFKKRMGDISNFMKILKQRFSIWYRHAHAAFQGTLWEGRFRSVMVEGVPAALTAVSSYIDLNPVRARIVDDPKDYRWSGYSTAIAGDAISIDGISKLFENAGGSDGAMDRRRAFMNYRKALYMKGSDAIDKDKVKDAVQKREAMPLPVLLRFKIRHFLSGVFLGSSDFVDGQFEKYKNHFGLKRKRGARCIGICKEWNGLRLCSARKLRNGGIVIA